MSISIGAHNTEITTAIRDYIEKRLDGLSKYTAGEPTITVEVSKTTNHHRQGDIFEAKIHLATSLGKAYHAASQKSDLYEAIDDVRNEMMRELSSAKDKKATLLRRGALKIKSLIRGFRS